MTGEFEYVKDIGYDEFGQRVVMEYGNGVRTEYSYSPERRWLERIVTVDGTGTRLQNITYDINPVGNVRGYENAADGYSTKQTYGYDNLYQLVKADGESKNYQAGSGLVTMSSAYSQVFSFDGAGNGKLVGKTSSERTMGTRNGDNLNYSLQYRYYAGTHKAEQIGEMYYKYDGNGNLVSERFGGHAAVNANNAQVYEEDGIYSTDYGFGLVHPEAGQGERRAYQRDYRWNERNLLSRSVDDSYRVEYRYGGDGERAVKYSLHAAIEGETLYFNKFFQTDYSSGRGGWLESKHVFVGETRIATKRRTEGNTGNYGEENNQLYYYHGDHLGSAQLVTDYLGKTYEQLEYTPYGELWVEHVPVVEATPFRFTGKERDGETGLYYFGARYLNPQTSMWLSADPAMGEYVPLPGTKMSDLPGMGGIYNTINFHSFAYAGNNPVKIVDPSGMWIDNNDGTYTAEKGDTLWGLYGSEWQEKSGYTGDPRQLQIGDVIGQKRERTPMEQFGDEFSKATGGRTIQGTIDWYNSGNFDGGPLTESMLFDLFNDPSKAHNLLMNNVHLHKDLREYLNESNDMVEWKKAPGIVNLFHGFWKNDKYLSTDGYRERIRARNGGAEEKSDRYKSSFNFFPFKKSVWGHYLADVYPASKWGN